MRSVRCSKPTSATRCSCSWRRKGRPPASPISTGSSAIPRSAAISKAAPDAHVVRFWRTIAVRAGGEASLENIAPYIVSKLAQISGNALIRPILCSPTSSLDIPRALAEGRHVLVNLARGLAGGPDAALLGGIITIRLFAAAMARAGMPASARRPVRVYLDEFQTHARAVLGEMMAEARKFGPSLVLANQSVAQVDQRGGDIAHAILANAGSLISFEPVPATPR